MNLLINLQKKNNQINNCLVSQNIVPKVDPAFAFYSTNMHETVKKENPGLKFYQIYSILFENWKSILLLFFVFILSFILVHNNNFI